MSNIVRPTKSASGTRNYIPNTVILSDEVNMDFNRIYDDYDGNITDFNISPNAQINPAKLDRSVPWINSADIVDGSIVNADIAAGANIDRSKLAAPVVASGVAVSGLTAIQDTPTTVLTLSPVVFDGGYVQLLAWVGAHFRWLYTLPNPFIQPYNLIEWRWFRDAVQILVVNQTFYARNNTDEPTLTGDFFQSLTLAAPVYIDTPGVAGTYTYSLQVNTAQLLATGFIATPSSNAGVGYAVVLR